MKTRVLSLHPYHATETDEYYYTEEDGDYVDYYDGDYYYEEGEYTDSGITDQGPSRGDQAPSQGAIDTPTTTVI